MHKTTSSQRKSFKLVALFGTLFAALGSAAALIATVSPAQAANFASQADIQVAVFMVPLTLLLLVMLFEVTRFIMRGQVPAQAQPVRPRRTLSSRPRAD